MRYSMFARFESLDKTNNEKLTELQKKGELSKDDLNLIKKAINAAHLRVDHALIRSTDFDPEYSAKEKVIKEVEEVLGKEMSEQTRTKLTDILTTATQKMCGRYYTSLVNGYCSYTGLMFQSFNIQAPLEKKPSVLPGLKSS